jgi:hypothetical protein
MGPSATDTHAQHSGHGPKCHGAPHHTWFGPLQDVVWFCTGSGIRRGSARFVPVPFSLAFVSSQHWASTDGAHRRRWVGLLPLLTEYPHPHAADEEVQDDTAPNGSEAKGHSSVPWLSCTPLSASPPGLWHPSSDTPLVSVRHTPTVQQGN